MKRFLPLVLFVALGTGFWKWRASHPTWNRELANSPALTLYSLDPHRGMGNPNDERINRFRVLGKIVLRGPDRQKAFDAVNSAEHDDGLADSCIFSPRVAIETEDKQTRVVLCFSCGDAEAEIRGAKQKFFRIHTRGDEEGKTSENQLNALLRRAHVPLAPLGFD